MLDVKKIKFWNAVTELIYQYLKHKIKDKKSRSHRHRRRQMKGRISGV